MRTSSDSQGQGLVICFILIRLERFLLNQLIINEGLITG